MRALETIVINHPAIGSVEPDGEGTSVDGASSSAASTLPNTALQWWLRRYSGNQRSFRHFVRILGARFGHALSRCVLVPCGSSDGDQSSRARASRAGHQEGSQLARWVRIILLTAPFLLSRLFWQYGAGGDASRRCSFTRCIFMRFRYKAITAKPLTPTHAMRQRHVQHSSFSNQLLLQLADNPVPALEPISGRDKYFSLYWDREQVHR